MKNLLSIARLAALALSFVPGVVYAGYLGQTVEADYRYPTVSTNYVPAGGPLSAVVGPGVEFFFFPGDNNPTVNVSDGNILIAYPIGFNLDAAPNPFDGIVVTSISPGIPDIVGVSLAGTNIPGVVGLSFDARHVYVNQDSLSNTFDPGAFISVDVRFGTVSAAAPVLSPPALGVSLLVLMGFGILRLQRRVVSA